MVQIIVVPSPRPIEPHTHELSVERKDFYIPNAPYNPTFYTSTPISTSASTGMISGPIPGFTPITNLHYTVTIENVMTRMPMPLTIMYDPMNDYIQWYFQENPEYIQWQSAMVDIDNSSLHLKFWDFRKEIETWIFEHCSEPVLLQKSSEPRGSGHGDGGGWRFVFVDGRNMGIKFLNWFAKKRRDHQFVIADIDQEIFDQIDAWFIDNVHGSKYLYTHFSAGRASRSVDYFIQRDHEAVEFKLKWSDYLLHSHSLTI